MVYLPHNQRRRARPLETSLTLLDAPHFTYGAPDVTGYPILSPFV